MSFMHEEIQGKQQQKEKNGAELSCISACAENSFHALVIMIINI